MFDKVSRILVAGATVVAAGATLFGVGSLAVDIGPSIIDYVSNTSWVIPGSIATLGIITLTFCGVIGKPFDALMDRMYPNDVKPSVGG